MRCSACEQDLPDEAFSWRSRHKGQRQHRCKPCLREYQREWHAKTGDRRRAQIRRVNDRNRAERQAYVDAFKAEHGCAHCGEHDVIVLDCHHVGMKTDSIARMIGRSTLDRIKVELEQCIVLCANCHRRHHHKTRRSGTRGGAALS